MARSVSKPAQAAASLVRRNSLGRVLGGLIGAREVFRIERLLGVSVSSLLGVLVSSLLGAQAVASSGTVAAQSPGRSGILVLGDSLSAEYGLKRGSGWVALLEQRLRQSGGTQTVTNASISGETTAGGRTRLPELLSRHRPALVIIELGGNDALRGLPLASTEANLKAMIRASRDSGARVLVLGMQMPPNYGAAYGQAFEAVFERASRDEGAERVAFFLKGIGERIEFFQADRIHPTEQAQPLMLDNVWPVLRRMLAGPAPK
jgi:acyl-CoA thioesterase-1